MKLGILSEQNDQRVAVVPSVASKLKEHNSSWGKAWIQNMLTLSYDNFSQPIISHDDEKLTFQLKKRLINYITDASELNKSEEAIADIQKQIVDYFSL